MTARIALVDGDIDVSIRDGLVHIAIRSDLGSGAKGNAVVSMGADVGMLLRDALNDALPSATTGRAGFGVIAIAIDRAE